MELKGKTALVTGATSGIGLEAAVALARFGARVAIVGRDPKKTADSLELVKRRSASSDVESFLCDFSSQKSIRAFAESFRQAHKVLHLLVNNAGTVFPHRTVTEDGIEATFAVNHLGYFLLTNLLLDLLVGSAPARIVNVASKGHYRGTLDFDNLGFEKGGYQVMRAYGRSKLANVLFTQELARRLEGKQVTVNCLHPGVVATNIWSHAPTFVRPFIELFKRFAMISPEEGGGRIVYAAT
jgi:NAD(P)-dependent dehydrogenase (short-subunit alcohol dehydrogenase family)